jgi:hypothetical protein
MLPLVSVGPETKVGRGMTRKIRILKWLALGLLSLIIAAQFIRPARSNPTVVETQSIAAHTQLDPQVSAILDRSCADCHSNQTRWPWYSSIAPASWFVIDHVNHGRSHLNFSEWSRYERREAEDLLGAICKEVQNGAMPLTSYTRVHRNAEMSADDVRLLCEWTSAEQERIALR